MDDDGSRHWDAQIIDRPQVLAQIADPMLALVALTAPAGYGKTTLANMLMRMSPSFAVFDCSGVDSERSLAERVFGGLAIDDERRADALARARMSLDESNAGRSTWSDFALSVWRAGGDVRSVCIFENAEAIFARDGPRELLYRLLAAAVPQRTTVICSRTSLPFRLTRFAPPHRVITVRESMMAFTPTEIATIFPQTPAALTDQVFRATRGWPIAVLLLRRLARQEGLEAAIGKLPKLADELSGYLIDEVFRTLPERAFRALSFCALASDATRLDLAAVLGADGARFDFVEDLRGLPFVAIDGETVQLHPLVATTVRERFPFECREIVATVAHAHLANGRAMRAAVLYMAVGERDSAASALDTIAPYVFTNAFPDCAAVASQLDADTLCAYPGLWLATIPTRLFGMPLAEYVREARQMWFGLPVDCGDALRIAMLIRYTFALYYDGAIEDCFALLEEHLARLPPAAEHRSAVLLHLAGMAGVQGRYRYAEELCRSARADAASAFSRGRLLDALEAHRAFTHGDYERGFSLLEQSLLLARRSGVLIATTTTLTNGLAFAWIAGDDARLASYLAQLEALLVPGIERGYRFFVACLRGEPVEDDVSCPNRATVACGHLVRAGSLKDRVAAGKAALQAVRYASLAREPYLQTLAWLAVAHLVEGRRAEAVAAAIAAAATIESAPLAAAVQAVSSGSADGGILASYVNRRLRRPNRATPAPVRIEVLSGRVSRGDEEIILTDRELELIVLLAVNERAVSRDRIVDALWPDLDGDSAANNLKVQVHRLRRKLGGNDMIAYRSDAYELGTAIEVDSREIGAKLRSLRKRAITAEDLRWLLAAHECFRTAGRAVTGRWSWFEQTERELVEMQRELCVVLSRHALSEGEGQRALEFATTLVRIDPYDETARELAIRAHCALDDRSNALRELRQYRDILRSELGTEPSAVLKEIILDVEHHEVAS